MGYHMDILVLNAGSPEVVRQPGAVQRPEKARSNRRNTSLDGYAAFPGAKARLTTALAALTRFRGALAVLVMAIALIPSARLAWNSRDMPLLSAMSDDGIYLVGAKS